MKKETIEKKWAWESDDESDYICYGGGSNNDESFIIYLPSEEGAREFAIGVIVSALNKAGIVIE